MKQQVERFSPHQNGKVFAILMTLSSCVFILPMAIFASAFAPSEAGMPGLLLLLMPLMYLVIGYVSIAIGCLMYNFMFKYIGGIEFESRPGDA